MGVSVVVGLAVELGEAVKTAVVAAIFVMGNCVEADVGLASANWAGFCRDWYTIARIRPADRQMTSTQTKVTIRGSRLVVVNFRNMIGVSAMKQ